MKIFKICIALMLSSHTFAQTPTGNLLYNCKGKWNCEVKEITLFQKQDYDSEFEMEYSYECMGHPIEVGAELGDTNEKGYTKALFERGKLLQKLILQGFGPLRVKDFDAVRTRKAFLNDCRIEIHSAKITGPSQKAVDNWQTEKQRIEQDLVNHRSSSKVFCDLTTLIQTFVAVEDLFELAKGSCQKNSKHKDQIKEMLKCSGDQSLEDCNLLETLLLNPKNLLSAEEKRAFYKLNLVLQGALENSATCPEFSLEKLLSAKQLEVLTNMIRKKETLSENEEKYLHFKNLEDASQEELRVLWCQSKDHMEWNGENHGDCH